MPANTFGQFFRVTTFGESHGVAIGAVVDGCPAGLHLTADDIQKQLNRRKPGQSSITTPRIEEDQMEILSGVFDGKTTGSPVALLIRNKDARPGDYDHLKHAYRPSHADFTWEAKYGFRDHRGGGRASARETAARVAAGAIAACLLAEHGIQVCAYVSAVGHVKSPQLYDRLDIEEVDAHPVRCPFPETAALMLDQIEIARDEGDSLGGVITGIVRNCPAGLGEPVFDKLHARLGYAILGINACKGFEIGSGFEAARMRGTHHNDAFSMKDGKPVTLTNFSGGVQGGISNGMDIVFRAAFKPVATIRHWQQSINRDGRDVTIEGKGRHDPCVVPRAVPIVEAMTSLVIADFLLAARHNKL